MRIRCSYAPSLTVQSDLLWLCFRSAHDINERQRMLLSKLQAESDKLSPTAQAALKEAIQVAEGLDSYLDEISTSPPEILNEMIKKTYDTDWKKLYQDKVTSIPLIKEMCAGGYEAVLLREFATMVKVGGLTLRVRCRQLELTNNSNQAKRILEIGVFASTTTVALALLPFVEKIVALDIEPYLVEFANPFYEKAEVSDKIDFRIGDAIKTLEDLESKNEGFDLVFIDADKGGYWNYYDKIMSSKILLNPDGVIIAVSLHSSSLLTFFDSNETPYYNTIVLPHYTGQYNLQSIDLRTPRSIRRRCKSTRRVQ